MKLVVTEIKRSIDGLKRFKINIDSLFLAVISQNCAAVQNEPIIRHSVVQFELLLSRGDCVQHRISAIQQTN
jgi:hypothetical protein